MAEIHEWQVEPRNQLTISTWNSTVLVPRGSHIQKSSSESPASISTVSLLGLEADDAPLFFPTLLCDKKPGESVQNTILRSFSKTKPKIGGINSSENKHSISLNGHHSHLLKKSWKWKEQKNNSRQLHVY